MVVALSEAVKAVGPRRIVAPMARISIATLDNWCQGRRSPTLKGFTRLMYVVDEQHAVEILEDTFGECFSVRGCANLPLKDALAHALKSEEVSNYSLSVKSAVTAQTLSRWISGEALQPRLTQVLRVANALHYKRDFISLLFGVE